MGTAEIIGDTNFKPVIKAPAFKVVLYFTKLSIAFTFDPLLLNSFAATFKINITIISLHKLLNIINIRSFILTFFFRIILSLINLSNPHKNHTF